MSSIANSAIARIVTERNFMQGGAAPATTASSSTSTPETRRASLKERIQKLTEEERLEISGQLDYVISYFKVVGSRNPATSSTSAPASDIQEVSPRLYDGALVLMLTAENPAAEIPEVGVFGRVTNTFRTWGGSRISSAQILEKIAQLKTLADRAQMTEISSPATSASTSSPSGSGSSSSPVAAVDVSAVVTEEVRSINEILGSESTPTGLVVLKKLLNDLKTAAAAVAQKKWSDPQANLAFWMRFNALQTHAATYTSVYSSYSLELNNEITELLDFSRTLFSAVFTDADISAGMPVNEAILQCFAHGKISGVERERYTTILSQVLAANPGPPGSNKASYWKGIVNAGVGLRIASFVQTIDRQIAFANKQKALSEKYQLKYQGYLRVESERAQAASELTAKEQRKLVLQESRLEKEREQTTLNALKTYLNAIALVEGSTLESFAGDLAPVLLALQYGPLQHQITYNFQSYMLLINRLAIGDPTIVNPPELPTSTDQRSARTLLINPLFNSDHLDEGEFKTRITGLKNTFEGLDLSRDDLKLRIICDTLAYLHTTVDVALIRNNSELQTILSELQPLQPSPTPSSSTISSALSEIPSSSPTPPPSSSGTHPSTTAIGGFALLQGLTEGQFNSDPSKTALFRIASGISSEQQKTGPGITDASRAIQTWAFANQVTTYSSLENNIYSNWLAILREKGKVDSSKTIVWAKENFTRSHTSSAVELNFSNLAEYNEYRVEAIVDALKGISR